MQMHARWYNVRESFQKPFFLNSKYRAHVSEIHVEIYYLRGLARKMASLYILVVVVRFHDSTFRYIFVKTKPRRAELI